MSQWVNRSGMPLEGGSALGTFPYIFIVNSIGVLRGDLNSAMAESISAFLSPDYGQSNSGL